MARFRFLAFSAALLGLFISASAFAQSETIKVIHDDGSVDVLDLDPDKYQTPPPEEPVPPRPTEEKESPPPAQPSPPPAQEKPAIEKKAEKEQVKKKEAKKEKAKPKAKSKEKKKKAEAFRPPQPVAARAFPPGTVVTPELATSIALDHAPPARDMKVSQAIYEGKKVFVVTFRTEDGPVDVLVDAETGAVIKPKKNP